MKKNAFLTFIFACIPGYDLIRHLAAGEPKDDDLLLPANWDNIRAILPQHQAANDDHRAFLRLRLCV